MSFMNGLHVQKNRHSGEEKRKSAVSAFCFLLLHDKSVCQRKVKKSSFQTVILFAASP